MEKVTKRPAGIRPGDLSVTGRMPTELQVAVEAEVLVTVKVSID